MRSKMGKISELKLKIGILIHSTKIVYKHIDSADESQRYWYFLDLIRKGYKLNQRDIDKYKGESWFQKIFLEYAPKELISAKENSNYLVECITKNTEVYMSINKMEKLLSSNRLDINQQIVDLFKDYTFFGKIFINNAPNELLFDEKNYDLLLSSLTRKEIARKIDNKELLTLLVRTKTTTKLIDNNLLKENDYELLHYLIENKYYCNIDDIDVCKKIIELKDNKFLEYVDVILLDNKDIFYSAMKNGLDYPFKNLKENTSFIDMELIRECCNNKWNINFNFECFNKFYPDIYNDKNLRDILLKNRRYNYDVLKKCFLNGTITEIDTRLDLDSIIRYLPLDTILKNIDLLKKYDNNYSKLEVIKTKEDYENNLDKIKQIIELGFYNILYLIPDDFVDEEIIKFSIEKGLNNSNIYSKYISFLQSEEFPKDLLLKLGENQINDKYIDLNSITYNVNIESDKYEERIKDLIFNIIASGKAYKTYGLKDFKIYNDFFFSDEFYNRVINEKNPTRLSNLLSYIYEEERKNNNNSSFDSYTNENQTRDAKLSAKYDRILKKYAEFIYDTLNNNPELLDLNVIFNSYIPSSSYSKSCESILRKKDIEFFKRQISLGFKDVFFYIKDENTLIEKDIYELVKYAAEIGFKTDRMPGFMIRYMNENPILFKYLIKINPEYLSCIENYYLVENNFEIIAEYLESNSYTIDNPLIDLYLSLNEDKKILKKKKTYNIQDKESRNMLIEKLNDYYSAKNDINYHILFDELLEDINNPEYNELLMLSIEKTYDKDIFIKKVVDVKEEVLDELLNKDIVRYLNFASNDYIEKNKERILQIIKKDGLYSYFNNYKFMQEYLYNVDDIYEAIKILKTSTNSIGYFNPTFIMKNELLASSISSVILSKENNEELLNNYQFVKKYIKADSAAFKNISYEMLVEHPDLLDNYREGNESCIYRSLGPGLIKYFIKDEERIDKINLYYCKGYPDDLSDEEYEKLADIITKQGVSRNDSKILENPKLFEILYKKGSIGYDLLHDNVLSLEIVEILKFNGYDISSISSNNLPEDYKPKKNEDYDIKRFRESSEYREEVTKDGYKYSYLLVKLTFEDLKDYLNLVDQAVLYKNIDVIRNVNNDVNYIIKLIENRYFQILKYINNPDISNNDIFWNKLLEHNFIPSHSNSSSIILNNKTYIMECIKKDPKEIDYLPTDILIGDENEYVITAINNGYFSLNIPNIVKNNPLNLVRLYKNIPAGYKANFLSALSAEVFYNEEFLNLVTKDKDLNSFYIVELFTKNNLINKSLYYTSKIIKNEIERNSSLQLNIDKYFDGDMPTKELFDVMLFQKEYIELIFTNKLYIPIYKEYYKESSSILSYIDFILDEGYNEAINSLSDIDKLFDENGPTKELFDIGLLNNDLFRKLFKEYDGRDEFACKNDEKFTKLYNQYYANQPEILQYIKFIDKNYGYISINGHGSTFRLSFDINDIDTILKYFDESGPTKKLFDDNLHGKGLYQILFKEEYKELYSKYYSEQPEVLQYIKYCDTVGRSKKFNNPDEAIEFIKKNFDESGPNEIFLSTIYFDDNEYLSMIQGGYKELFDNFFQKNPEILQYSKFKEKCNCKLSIIRSLEHIKYYFNEQGPKKELYDEILYDTKTINLIYIDEYKPLIEKYYEDEPEVIGYIKFVNTVGYDNYDTISFYMRNKNYCTFKEILKIYFDINGPKKELFDLVLEDPNIAGILFNDEYKDLYENIYKDTPYIFRYMEFCKKYIKDCIRAIAIKEKIDIYFDEFGPKKELFDDIILRHLFYRLDNEIFDEYDSIIKKCYQNNPSMLSYINFIKSNDYLGIVNESTLNLYFDEFGPTKKLYDIALYNVTLFNMLFIDEKEVIIKHFSNEYLKVKYIEFVKKYGNFMFKYISNENDIKKWFDQKGFKYNNLSNNLNMAADLIINVDDWDKKVTDISLKERLLLIKKYFGIFNLMHDDATKERIFTVEFFNMINNNELLKEVNIEEFLVSNANLLYLIKDEINYDILISLNLKQELFKNILNKLNIFNESKFNEYYQIHESVSPNLRKKCFSKKVLENYDRFNIFKVVKYNLKSPLLESFFELFDSPKKIELLDKLYDILKNEAGDNLGNGTRFLVKLANSIDNNLDIYRAVIDLKIYKNETVIYNLLRFIYGKINITSANELTITNDNILLTHENIENLSTIQMKSKILKELIDMDYEEYQNFLERHMDLETLEKIKLKIETKLKMIYSNEPIDYEYANYLEENLRNLIMFSYLLKSLLNTINSTNDKEQLVILLQNILCNDYLAIKKFSINIMEIVRQIYEIDAQLTLTKISDVQREIEKSEDIKAKVLKTVTIAGISYSYYDLSKYEYALYAHVNDNVGSLFNSRFQGNSQLCLTPVSDRGLKSYYCSGIVYGFDSIPNGGFIASSSTNTGSNGEFYNNIEISKKFIDTRYDQKEIKESSALVLYGLRGHSETNTTRDGMHPCCVIIRGEEPTSIEIDAAKELAVYLGLPEGSIAPLVKIQAPNTRLPLSELEHFDFSIYSHMHDERTLKEIYASSDVEKEEKRKKLDILEKLKNALKKYNSVYNQLEKEKITQLRRVTLRTGASHDIYKCKINGIDYYVKPAIDGYNDAKHRAYAVKLGSDMQKLINPDNTVNVELSDVNIDGKITYCSLLEEKKNTNDFDIVDNSNGSTFPMLTDNQIESILRELIVDHLLFNYDTKGVNFLYDADNVYGIDKEQACKFCADTSGYAGLGINPKRQSGNGVAFYSVFLQHYKDKIDKNNIEKIYTDILEKVESISLLNFYKMYEPYLQSTSLDSTKTSSIIGRRLRLVEEVKKFLFDNFNINLMYNSKDYSNEIEELNSYLRNLGLEEIKNGPTK